MMAWDFFRNKQVSLVGKSENQTNIQTFISRKFEVSTYRTLVWSNILSPDINPQLAQDCAMPA